MSVKHRKIEKLSMYSDNYCRITIFGWDAFDDFNANFKRKFMIKSFCFLQFITVLSVKFWKLYLIHFFSFSLKRFNIAKNGLSLIHLRYNKSFKKKISLEILKPHDFFSFWNIFKKSNRCILILINRSNRYI